MSKRIIFCSDGTWETPDKRTNVYKLFNSLITDATQIPFYASGVGTNVGPVGDVVGGAFGVGLQVKIKEGYASIAHVYEAGDKIYLFGFSRGAYTARSLAGMIAATGLPTKNFSNDMVNKAFLAYRASLPDARQQLLKDLENCDMDTSPDIEMVGVWDTVGSLGIPAVVGGTDPVADGFLDLTLNPRIKHGYHALAINERRAQFQATLWNEGAGEGQTLEQVWFTGCHGDVGGGEGDESTALSDVTLAWMLDKAAACGLQFDPNKVKQYTCPMNAEYALDQIHESWKIFCGFPIWRPIRHDSLISNSVAIRCQDDSNYRPHNLTFENGTLASTYSLSTICTLPAAIAASAAAAATPVSNGGSGAGAQVAAGVSGS